MASDHSEDPSTGHAGGSEGNRKRKSPPTEENTETKRPALEARQITPVPAANEGSVNSVHVTSTTELAILKPGIDTAGRSLLDDNTGHPSSSFSSLTTERGPPPIEPTPCPPNSSATAAEQIPTPPAAKSKTTGNGPTLNDAIEQCESEFGKILDGIAESIIWVKDYKVDPGSDIQDPALCRIYLVTFDKMDKVKAALRKVQRHRSSISGTHPRNLHRDLRALHARIEELGAFLASLQSSMGIHYGTSSEEGGSGDEESVSEKDAESAEYPVDKDGKDVAEERTSERLEG